MLDQAVSQSKQVSIEKKELHAALESKNIVKRLALRSIEKEKADQAKRLVAKLRKEKADLKEKNM